MIIHAHTVNPVLVLPPEEKETYFMKKTGTKGIYQRTWYNRKSKKVDKKEKIQAGYDGSICGMSANY